MILFLKVVMGFFVVVVPERNSSVLHLKHDVESFLACLWAG